MVVLVGAAADLVEAAPRGVGKACEFRTGLKVLKRLLSHLVTPDWRVKRVLGAAAMKNIEQAISDSEKLHSGEIRFAAEAALDTMPLLQGVTARQRAIEVFSQLRIWDTEQNNGVLIYLLLADRDVEIIADRGINTKIEQHVWQSICEHMETLFRAGRFEQGVLTGIGDISTQLQQSFPTTANDRNELPNTPHLF